jgi:hypothetical protein
MPTNPIPLHRVPAMVTAVRYFSLLGDGATAEEYWQHCCQRIDGAGLAHRRAKLDPAFGRTIHPVRSGIGTG